MKKETNTFTNCRDYQRHLRRTGNILDIVQIGKTVYTMDEYDHDGKYMSYGNKRTGYALQVDTQNRYTTLKDAKVYRWKAYCYRNDICYVD